MAVYPKKEIISKFESSGREVTVYKFAYSSAGFSHYEVHVPTDVADRYDWSSVELDFPGSIDYSEGYEVIIDTGHVDLRNVGVDGDRLPGDMSDADARVIGPSDVEAAARRLCDAVEDAERKLGAFWSLEA